MLTLQEIKDRQVKSILSVVGTYNSNQTQFQVFVSEDRLRDEKTLTYRVLVLCNETSFNAEEAINKKSHEVTVAQDLVAQAIQDCVGIITKQLTYQQ